MKILGFCYENLYNFAAITEKPCFCETGISKKYCNNHQYITKMLYICGGIKNKIYEMERIKTYC